MHLAQVQKDAEAHRDQLGAGQPGAQAGDADDELTSGFASMPGPQRNAQIGEAPSRHWTIRKPRTTRSPNRAPWRIPAFVGCAMTVPSQKRSPAPNAFAAGLMNQEECLKTQAERKSLPSVSWRSCQPARKRRRFYWSTLASGSGSVHDRT